MGRRKKQNFSFPSADEQNTLDAAFVATAEETKADSAAKKEVKKAAQEIPEIFTPDQVAWIFNVYALLLSFVYSIVFKSDVKLIFEELKFEDKEALDMAVPLARIASKYAPVEWAGMTAEIQLIAMLGTWTVMSVKRVSKVVQDDREKKEAEARQQNIPTGTRPINSHTPSAVSA